ncbi:tyrosine aminotransferase, tyrosine-repressible, PLP-dependent, partial [Escherichia coli]
LSHRQRSHVCRRVKYGKCTTCGKGVCCGDVMQESRLELPSLQ